jgi:hypothetical protein
MQTGGVYGQGAFFGRSKLLDIAASVALASVNPFWPVEQQCLRRY